MSGDGLHLAAPAWLWALWAVPLLAFVAWWGARRAARRRSAFVGRLAPRLVEGGGAHPRAAVLVLAGVGGVALALARPGWGVYYEEVHSEGMELVVLVDVSRSMLAEDAAPNRLERARIAVDGLIDRLEERGGHRVGLVEFAGVPVVRSPVTSDYAHVRAQLRRIGCADVPRGGTLLGDAVRRAVALLDHPGDHDRVIVLLTDGEDHESFPLEAARAAADAHVAIFAVGIGDATDGGRIPYVDGDGVRRFVEDDGKPVVSRLDEETLRTMAEVTGGGYVPAGTRTIPLDRIWDEAIAPRRTAQVGTTRERRHHERFQWPLGAALVLVVLSRFAAPKGAA